MLVTVDEAKNLWCPMARTRIDVVGQEVTVNRHYDPKASRVVLLPSTLCVADDCMAWCSVPGTNKGYCGLSDK